MAEPMGSGRQPAPKGDPNRARDHLANERTFLAWMRTGVALIVSGFAIDRLSIVVRQTLEVQERASGTGGLWDWFGALAIIAGVFFTGVGLLRYRRTRAQLESGQFEPAGLIIYLVGILTALFGLALVGYLVYTKL